MTNSASLHLDAYFARARLGNLALDDLEIRPRFRNLRCLHRRDCDFCSRHSVSFGILVLTPPTRKLLPAPPAPRAEDSPLRTPGATTSFLLRRRRGEVRRP